MQAWIQGLLENCGQYGYLIVFLLIAIENIFPPIPSEVILTFGGFLTTYTTMKVWGVVIASTAGSVFGAIILYGVGRLFPPERLERWLDGRLGRILHLKGEDIHRAQGWFDKRGKITVFICRFIPLIRSLISIPAGIARMPMPIFLLLTTAGTFIWNTVLVCLGAAFGSSWELIAGYMDIYSKIGVIILGIAFVVFAVIFYKKRQNKKGKQQAEDKNQNV